MAALRMMVAVRKNSLLFAWAAMVASALVAQELPPQTKVTPNAERDVEVVALDKRTGQQRVFKGHPGEGFDFGALAIAVKTCETTPPWESKLTGAFLQIDEKGRSATRRIFSGWMFAESPSLNPLEHPRYDVWVRSCAMRWPDMAPGSETTGPTSRSSAEKSPSTAKASASSER